VGKTNSQLSNFGDKTLPFQLGVYLYLFHKKVRRAFEKALAGNEILAGTRLGFELEQKG
jgi:hypothetical protein